MNRRQNFVCFGWGILLASLLLLYWQDVTFAQTSGDRFVTGQIVVKLNPLSNATIDQINATYGTITLRPLVGAADIYLLQAPPGADVRALAALLDADIRLLYAEPNLYSEVIEGRARVKWARAGSDPVAMGQQYAPTLLNLPAARALSTGANTIVAVLDTGFQLDHPQLAGSFTDVQYDFLDNDALPTEEFTTLDPDGDGYVNELTGHGTHVAGIVHMVAPGAKIMPLRVMNSDGIGNEFAVAEAIQFALRNGALVINLSLGTPEKSELLKDVVQQTFENTQAVIVAAAGNENTKRKFWPAASSYVIAVTSVGPTKLKSPFANFGDWVDIAAPGEEIASAFPVNRYAAWSGTSFATPFISGQAALVRSRYPQIQNNKVRRRILRTAEPLTPELGAGFPNFVASLQRLDLNGTSVYEPLRIDAFETVMEDETASIGESAQDNTDDMIDNLTTQIFMPIVVTQEQAYGSNPRHKE